ncbi:MAG TPA: KR domain-containing protein, partial [Jatrophihabitans sp.]|nr:KR domain-containing protein [Jatrophihabitans sp.]
ERIDTAELTADYWVRNLREPVRFAPVIEQLAQQGHGVFVEASPHPVLAVAIGESLDGTGAITTGTLRRDEGGTRRLLLSLAEVWTHGATVDWTRLIPAGARAVNLPTYPFQRQRFWLEPAPVAAADPAEAGFWDAIDRNDLAALQATLGTEPVADAWSAVLPQLAGWRRARRGREQLDRWRYQVSWRTAELASTATLTGAWLLVSSSNATNDVTACTQALASAGAEVRTVTADAAELDRAGWAAVLATAGEQVSGIVSLLAADQRPYRAHPELTAGVAGTLALLQAQADLGLSAPVWCVTRGAAEPAEIVPAQAQIWGLGRVHALEQPACWGGLIDLGAGWSAADLVAALADSTTGKTRDDELALRDGSVLVRRLARAPLPDDPGSTWRPTGTVLVTGGTGVVGGHVARWLAEQGAAHLVLVSRRGPAAPGAASLRRELAARGARVSLVAGDAADRATLAGLLDRLAAEGAPVTAAVHAASAIELEPLAGTPLARLASTVAAKVLPAEHLDALLGPDVPLVLFSSITGVCGSAEHGAFAAANAHLDALATRRRAAGRPAVSIAWGVWDAANEADAPVVTARRRELNQRAGSRGLPPMDPDLGCAALGAVAGATLSDPAADPVSVLAEVEWTRFAELFTSVRSSRLLAEVVGDSAPAGEVGADSGLRERLAELPTGERRRAVLELVTAHVAAASGRSGAGAVEVSRPFKDLGFDSLIAVELRNRLTAATGLALPPTLVYDHPTPGALADHLLDQFAPSTGTAGLLGELDRLAGTLAEQSLTDGDRALIGQRLQALAWQFAAEPEQAGSGADDDLAAATAAEMFDLIDRELGTP